MRPETYRLVIDSLFCTLTNVNFDETSLREQLRRVHAEHDRLVPGCAVCTSAYGRNADFDMQAL